jgi:protein-S-isoprenylcysteine O-methyltransferase Ste14
MARELLDGGMIPRVAPRMIEVEATRPNAIPPFPRWVYRSRGVLVAPVIVAASATAWRSQILAADVGIGGALFLLGWTIRIWAQRHLGYRVRNRMRLTTCGPYRWVRNPIYIANTLIVVGTTAMTGAYWLMATSTLLCGAVYSLTALHEEGALGRRYGAPYRAYAALTPRWIPSQPPSSGSGCESRRSWPEVVAAECHVPLILVPVLLPWVIR